MNGNAVMKFGMADMHVGLAGHAWQPHFQILSALYPHVCAENFSPFTFTFCHDDFDHICHRKENILMDASSAKLSLTLVRRSVYVSKIRLPNLVAQAPLPRGQCIPTTNLASNLLHRFILTLQVRTGSSYGSTLFSITLNVVAFSALPDTDTLFFSQTGTYPRTGKSVATGPSLSTSLRQCTEAHCEYR